MKNNYDLLLMIATPDKAGLWRFPPESLKATLNSPNSRGIEKENQSAFLENGFWPYIGLWLHNVNSAQEKSSLNHFLSSLFGQEMTHYWKSHPLINEEITAYLQKHVANPTHNYDTDQPTESSPRLSYLRLIEVTLPLGESSWPNLPQIIRELPATKLRVPYLRIMQVLMGQHLEVTNAISVDDLKKHLSKSKKK